jgi:hypothetical protein
MGSYIWADWSRQGRFEWAVTYGQIGVGRADSNGQIQMGRFK